MISIFPIVIFTLCNGANFTPNYPIISLALCERFHFDTFGAKVHTYVVMHIACVPVCPAYVPN